MKNKAAKTFLLSVYMMLMAADHTTAQTFTVLKNFSGSDGRYPQFGGLAWSSNTLYGMTYSGGSEGAGTIFKLNTDGTSFTVLKNFTNSPDGFSPYASVIVSDNTLYGMTARGGNSDFGTIFKINTDGTGYTLLKSFQASDGSFYPEGNLALSGDTLFGTTQTGYGYGTVFRINTNGTGYSVLKNFDGGLNEGELPFAGSLAISNDVIYGLGSLALFKVNTNGNNFTVINNFNNNQYWTNTLYGYSSSSSFVILSGETIYSTTRDNSSGTNYGTVFKINTDGTGLTALKIFTNSLDGQTPFGNLTLSGNKLYGTTRVGGKFGYGNVYVVNTDGTGFNVLKDFKPTTYNPSISAYTNDGGAYPQAGLTLVGDTLYGTATFGGNYGVGTVFSIKIPFALTAAPQSIGLNRQFNFTISGPAGSNTVIYVSTNLQSWIPLTTNSLGGGTMIFTDMLATNYLNRFYRATLLP